MSKEKEESNIRFMVPTCENYDTIPRQSRYGYYEPELVNRSPLFAIAGDMRQHLPKYQGWTFSSENYVLNDGWTMNLRATNEQEKDNMEETRDDKKEAYAVIYRDESNTLKFEYLYNDYELIYDRKVAEEQAALLGKPGMVSLVKHIKTAEIKFG